MLLATDRCDEVNGCIFTAICCNSKRSYLLKQFSLRHMRHATFRCCLGLLGSFLNYVFVISFLDTFHLV